jgi:hypothetical protein
MRNELWRLPAVAGVTATIAASSTAAEPNRIAIMTASLGKDAACCFLLFLQHLPSHVILS